MLSGINPSDFMNTLFPDNFILCQKPGKEAVLIPPSKCIACGACVAGCPSGALSIVDWDAVTSAAQAAYKDL